jgi:hypothetical protein
MEHEFLVVATYCCECCPKSHALPVRVKATSETVAKRKLLEYLDDNDVEEVLVFENVAEVETLDEILQTEGGEDDSE